MHYAYVGLCGWMDSGYVSHGELDVDLIVVTYRIPGHGDPERASFAKPWAAKGPTPRRNETQVGGNERQSLHWDQSSMKTTSMSRSTALSGTTAYGDNDITELSRNGAVLVLPGIMTVPSARSSVCFVPLDHPTGESRSLFTPGANAVWTHEHFLSVEQLGGGMRPDLVVAQMEI
ncbi:uncharacterized protein PG986_004246 [Apiospora aurea]|uniref:Uncharacterized protein n=1 Tax=Apiospora aurea TaxID=335848 RepID=A0ABR1QM16_9PEZI